MKLKIIALLCFLCAVSVGISSCAQQNPSGDDQPNIENGAGGDNTGGETDENGGNWTDEIPFEK